MKWHYEEDIDYFGIEKSMVNENEFLLYFLSSASFVEIAADTYVLNLSNYFSDNAEAVSWLKGEWGHEEVQHGEALKKYVQTVWPDFEWQEAYERFLAEYLPLCNLNNLQPTKAREMLARMIVETGTSTFYRGMEAYATEIGEPVLAKIAHNIYKDEVRHYSHFGSYFISYNGKEKNSRTEMLRVIYQRIKEADSEDILLAYKAIYTTMHEGMFDPKAFDDYKESYTKYAKKHYPYTMAIKMLLHPLHLNRGLERAMVPTIKGAIRLLGL